MLETARTDIEPFQVRYRYHLHNRGNRSSTARVRQNAKCEEIAHRGDVVANEVGFIFRCGIAVWRLDAREGAAFWLDRTKFLLEETLLQHSAR